VEIKQLLETMLNNLNQGHNIYHGLVSVDGKFNLDHPEKVFRKPHTYITADEFRDIRNTNDHETSLNRLNLAIEKIVKNWTRPAQLPVPQVTPRPLKPYVSWVSNGCEHLWPNREYLFTESEFSTIQPSEFRVKLVSVLFHRLTSGNCFDNVVRNTYTGRKESEVIEMEQKVNDILNSIYQKL
jgi:hypothetical protein